MRKKLRFYRMMISLLLSRKERANELKQLRIKAGLSQVRVFELSGLTTKTIHTIECGEKSWNIDSEIIYINTILNFIKNQVTI